MNAVVSEINKSDNVIPPMTHPDGQYWKQPFRDNIIIDDKYALMSVRTFTQLLDYSGSFPSGVYPGKMWKRLDGVHNPKRTLDSCVWYLCWYSDDGDPGFCKNNYREILIA